jgi:hypothetical protein
VSCIDREPDPDRARVITAERIPNGACQAIGCNKPARGRWCWAHHKRFKGGPDRKARPIGSAAFCAPAQARLDPAARIHEDALLLVDATDAEDRARRLDNLRHSATNYALSIGFHPKHRGDKRSD